MSGPRVLVVDDAATVRAHHRGLLEQAGCRVQEAENGAVALELLREQYVDLVLTDVNMPVLDGLSLVARLRTELDLACPVVLVSTEAGPSGREAAARAGATLFLSKPVDPGVLERVVTLLTRPLAALTAPAAPGAEGAAP